MSRDSKHFKRVHAKPRRRVRKEIHALYAFVSSELEEYNQGVYLRALPCLCLCEFCDNLAWVV